MYIKHNSRYMKISISIILEFKNKRGERDKIRWASNYAYFHIFKTRSVHSSSSSSSSSSCLISLHVVHTISMVLLRLLGMCQNMEHNEHHDEAPDHEQEHPDDDGDVERHPAPELARVIVPAVGVEALAVVRERGHALHAVRCVGSCVGCGCGYGGGAGPDRDGGEQVQVWF